MNKFGPCQTEGDTDLQRKTAYVQGQIAKKYPRRCGWQNANPYICHQAQILATYWQKGYEDGDNQ